MLDRRTAVSRITAFLSAAAVRPALAQGGPVVEFGTFLPKSFDATDHDASGAIEAAADWSAATGVLVRVSGAYRLSSPVKLQGPVRLNFVDAHLTLVERGARTTTLNGATGRLGLYFRRTDGARLTGSLRVSGDGPPGCSNSAGLVFDECTGMQVDATIRVENLAAGCMVFHCRNCIFGDISASQMRGRQVFGTGTAGTALVAVGNTRCKFGAIHSEANYKPVLYCSVAFDAARRAIDNEACSFGMVTGSAADQSMESSLIAVRSARDCVFAGAHGRGFCFGYLIERYNSDTGFSVDGNRLGPLRGFFSATRNSTDAAVLVQSESGAVPIGTNVIESLDVQCRGEFGVAVFDGHLQCRMATIRGGARPVIVHSGTFEAEVVRIADQELEAVTIGRGGRMRIQNIEVLTGSRRGAGAAIRYNSAFGTGAVGQFSADRVIYLENGTGQGLQYLIYDHETPPAQWSVRETEGRPLRADAQIAGRDLNVENWAFREAL